MHKRKHLYKAFFYYETISLDKKGKCGYNTQVSGCGEVWYRAWFGSKRPWVRIPSLRPEKPSMRFIGGFLTKFALQASEVADAVKLLRSEVSCTSVLANLTSHRASARYFTAATPLLHLAKPNFTEPYHM